MQANTSSTNLNVRSKKLPPPPLCLPATSVAADEEKVSNSNQYHEQKKPMNQCSLSSSSGDCSHQSVPFILPASRRSQILETLAASSSSLLVPPPIEAKLKKSQTATHSNQANAHKQNPSSTKTIITENEWIEFVRVLLRKPLEREVKCLLDNYKMTYFDRMNAPNTNDEMIRSSLCHMVSEALNAYASSSISTQATNALMTNAASSSASTIIVNHNNNLNGKRKRKNINYNPLTSTPSTIDSETKFVISHIIPGQNDCSFNENKSTNQQQQIHFRKKYTHLFKYIPDKEVEEYLTTAGHLKISSTVVSHSSHHINDRICLMLYDEVVTYMDEHDLTLSDISIEDTFVLPESILARIKSCV